MGGAWTLPNTYMAPYDCLVFERPPGADIELEFTWGATAAHLLDCQLTIHGCGPSGVPTAVGGPEMREHWHTGPSDNSYARVTSYTLAGTQAQGAYSVGLGAYTRAFNPAGDGGGPATNWLTDYPYIYATTGAAFAVINA